MTLPLTVESKEMNPTASFDLRQQVGRCVWIQWALQAMHAVAARLPRGSGYTDGSTSPRMLLTLLAYCYATGTYGSEDIEWSCRNDADARYITANTCPDQDMIRHFRKANRRWIEECLAWVYAKARGLNPEELNLAEAVQLGNKMSLSARLLDRARCTVELAILVDTAMSD
jgi:hypothetical protein